MTTINHLDFNQDYSFIACATNNGITITHTNPNTKVENPNPIAISGGVKIVKMLYKSNILFFVGTGKDDKFLSNIVNIFDDHSGQVLQRIPYDAEIDDVKCNKNTLVILSADYAHIYDINNPSEPIVKYSISKNLCCLASTLSKPTPPDQSSQKNIFVYLDTIENNDINNIETIKYDVIKIVNLNTDIKNPKNIKVIKAHENNIACISLNMDGSLLATASVKGTIIRVFNTTTCEKVYEFRRGFSDAKIYNIVFSEDSSFMALLSTRGTLHIYNLKNMSANRKSVLSIISSAGGYFDSDWSFSWYYYDINDPITQCCFNKNNDIVAIYGDVKKLKVLTFDKENGGLCVN